MKPGILKIKGLNSFIEEQTIDFNRLSKRGLFGIFGPTGSGKSTILDAIILALYGEIPRNTKEFVNSEVDSLWVLYEFSIKYGDERKVYVVERTFKRNDEGLRKSKDARFYIKNTETDIDIIAEGITNVTKEIEKIIGLKADDFTRSVVLPQGKFSEFLRLTGAERRSMLERIFGLEKYGRQLGEKIKNAKDKKREELLNIESQLSVYGNITEEEYKELEESLKLNTQEEKNLRKELEEINKEYEKYQSIWELQKELSLYEEQLKELDKKEDEYSNKEKILKRAEDAEKIKAHIDELKEIRQKKEQIVKEIDLLQDKFNSLSKKKAEVEKQYQEALNNKNINHPLLLQKQANIDQAINILKDKNSMQEDRNKLREEYLINRETVKKHEDKEKIIANQINNIEEELKIIEEEKEKIYVEPTFREEIQKAYEIEKEYLNLKTIKEETKEKLDKLTLQIKDLKNQHEKVIMEKEKKIKILSKLNNEVKDLKDKFPANKDIIFEKHKYIQELKSKDKILDEQIKKKEFEESRLNELAKQLTKIEDLKENLFKEKENLKEKLEIINTEIEIIKKTNMAALLSAELIEGKPCPVCGSTSHKHQSFDLDEEKYNSLLAEEKILNKQFQEIEEKYQELYIKYVAIDNEKNQSKEEIKIINEILNNQEADKLKDKISREEENLKSLLSQINTIEKDIIEKEKNISALKDEVNYLGIEEARINEGILRDEKQYKDLQSANKDIEDKLNTIANEYNKIKEKFNLDNIEEKIKQITKWDKKRISYEEKEKNLREEIKAKEKEKESFKTIISKLSQENAAIEQSGKEKSEMIKAWEEQIKKLAEDKEPYMYRDEIKKAINDLLEKEAVLKDVFDKIKNEEEEVKEKNIKFKTQLETFNQNHIEKEERIHNLLQDYNFANYEEVLEAWIEKEKKETLEKDLKNYKETLKEVKSHISRIRKRIGEDKISKEEWESLKERKDKKSYELEMKNKRIAVIQEKLNILKKDLEKVSKLNRQKAELSRIYSMIDELSKLVQGYKFVEFIATNKLKYIAKEASKTLKQITMGRYALELDSLGNFIIRDDFNGGVRRSASTLSGGETFLTSLSLALALSSQIQLKNSSPLEFFFLDEGFGTLDNNLLDVVMSALERLHSQQLSVGIISHVEELKNRIPVKLIVESAVQGISGTKVRIE